MSDPNCISSALVLSLCVLLTAGVLLCYARQQYTATLVLIVSLGVVLRVVAATDGFLHPWDERFHALVAKNCVATPFEPVLYARPALPYDYREWGDNHVWLHKPPLTLWLMAGSMHLFGVSPFAARLPSVFLSSLLIVLTFAIGALLWDRRRALLAAALCAINHELINLASGREATDHPDTALTTLVTLGAYLVLWAWVGGRQVMMDLAVGAIAGLAYLTKGQPGLMVVGLWGVAALLRGGSLRQHVARFGLVMGVALVVASPWNVYARLTYPLESQWESDYTIRHLFETLEGHDHPWFYYFHRMKVWFGPAALIAAPWLLARCLRWRARPQLAWLATWFLVPHVLFSFVATKMPGYVAMTSSAGCLMLAFFVFDSMDLVLAKVRGRWRRGLLLGAVVMLVAYPLVRFAERLRLTGAYDRQPVWARQLSQLAIDCPNADAVVFGVQNPIEAMFAGNFTAYGRLPSQEEVRSIVATGREVILFDGGELPAWARELTGVRLYQPPRQPQ